MEWLHNTAFDWTKLIQILNYQSDALNMATLSCKLHCNELNITDNLEALEPMPIAVAGSHPRIAWEAIRS